MKTKKKSKKSVEPARAKAAKTANEKVTKAGKNEKVTELAKSAKAEKCTKAAKTAKSEAQNVAAPDLSKLPAPAAAPPGHKDEFSAEMLKWYGTQLEEKPLADRRIGGFNNSPEARNWREYLMWALLRIRSKSGHLRQFQLNHAQRNLDRRCTKRNIVLKARQLGITTYVAARFFINCITQEGTLTVQVAHDQRSAEEIFRIVHRFLDNLPKGLRKGALVTSRANVRQIVFPELDSEYRVETAADPNAGRGLTIRNLHCSEVARWPRDVAETLASLRAAVPPDGEIFLESTPNGAAGVFYDEWQSAGQTGYTRHFYPWWWDPAYERPLKITSFTEEEAELRKKHGLTTEQIAFRREMQVNFRSRAREEFAEDPESCFLASGECVFDLEIIEERLKLPAPIVEQVDNGRLLTFFPPITAANGGEAKQYIVAVDPAGGGPDGDYSCAEVIETANGLQCAELHGHFSPQELAARVAVLAQKYNRALVAVERNNHGHAVLAHLTMNQAYTNLYQTGGQLGWVTNLATRPRMLENFGALLSQAPFLFYSPRLLEECRTFIRHNDGTCSAARGAHDDTVMAMAIAQEVRRELRVKPPRSMEEIKAALMPPASPGVEVCTTL